MISVPNDGWASSKPLQSSDGSLIDDLTGQPPLCTKVDSVEVSSFRCPSRVELHAQFHHDDRIVFARFSPRL